ncbi:Qat anti-phage system TatD family nuclease QatD [Tahibacter caeni]|uniref:Qat anti-phage system TatD family nuclease QatD n=1 Tax=Tahibacter caeni TaxID=1453545 RepID=UPI0021482A25|nr:Qat anti-phage system TatD family nuclease QatD [Tahibacter caeni]
MTQRAVDFHCHLDLYPDPAAMVRRCADAGTYVLSLTTTPKAWSGTSALAKDHLRIRTALGLHPELAHERWKELPVFDEFLPRTRYVGEVGLDGSPDYRPHHAIQARVFEHVLSRCSANGGRILSIHSRRAATAVLDALERHRDAGIPVLHWFSGNSKELARAVAMGCWFSVGPAMVAGARGRALLSAMPPDRVLTETDGPFAVVDGTALRPGEVEGACSALGSCWGISAQEASQRVLSSFRALMAVQVGGPSISGGAG